MIFLCFNCSPFFVFFQVLDQKMHYGTTVLYCVIYFHLFYFHFFPYPRKLNDNEKLWIYCIYLFIIFIISMPLLSTGPFVHPISKLTHHVIHELKHYHSPLHITQTHKTALILYTFSEKDCILLS